MYYYHYCHILTVIQVPSEGMDEKTGTRTAIYQSPNPGESALVLNAMPNVHTCIHVSCCIVCN